MQQTATRQKVVHRKRGGGEEGEERVIMYMRKENLCRLNWERFYAKKGQFKWR